MLFKEGIVLQLAPNLTTFFLSSLGCFTHFYYVPGLQRSMRWVQQRYSRILSAEMGGASVQRGQDAHLKPQSSGSLLTLGILKLLDSWRLEGRGKWRLIQFNTYLLGQQ